VNLTKILKWLGIILGSVIALIVVLVIGVIVVSNYHTSQNKKYLQDAYNKVLIPSSMTLTNRYWIGGNIDTADYWHYKYSTVNSVQSTQEFQTSVMNAGYSVTAEATRLQSLPPTYVATDLSNGVRITFSPETSTIIQINVFRASINRDYP